MRFRKGARVKMLFDPNPDAPRGMRTFWQGWAYDLPVAVRRRRHLASNFRFRYLDDPPGKWRQVNSNIKLHKEEK